MYNVPDAELYLLCMEKLQFALRDLSAFANYNYDAVRLKLFQNLCERFKNLPTDDELLGDQMQVTEKKYEAAERTKTAIRSIMTRVETKYPLKSGRYRKFGTHKMGDMTDAQLLFCARRVVRVARTQLDALAETGLKEDHIMRLQEASRAFENALNTQQDRIADRDIAVESRVEVGNKMYADLVQICNIGKDIWAEQNRTKYDSYVLYESNNEQKKIAKQKLDEPTE